jgi:hypothetical protein
MVAPVLSVLRVSIMPILAYELVGKKFRRPQFLKRSAKY